MGYVLHRQGRRECRYWCMLKGRSTTRQSYSMRAVISVTHSVEINRFIFSDSIFLHPLIGGQSILSFVL